MEKPRKVNGQTDGGHDVEQPIYNGRTIAAFPESIPINNNTAY